MAWTYNVRKTRYLAFDKYHIPKSAKNIRKVDGRLKKYGNLKSCKHGYKIV